jgi:uncharacterized membrane protein YkoI
MERAASGAHKTANERSNSMSTSKGTSTAMKVIAAGAVAFGLAAGSYGVAAAAVGSDSSQSSTTSSNAILADVSAAAASSAQSPWGGQRADETPLTGTAESKVKALAEANVSGGTVVRVETDADGNAAYEAHMTKSDGTPVTVYVDKDFNVVSVESR